MSSDFKSQPMLSIIVPNYNNAIYLDDCINSILEQTFNNFEIIIADDCSTDNSLSVIQHYVKKHPAKIRSIYHKKNNGVAFNRHSAIMIAKGDYLTTLDSDDYYFDKHKLEKEISLIMFWKEHHSKEVCSFSNAIIVNSDKSIIKIRSNKRRIKEGDLLNDLLGRTCEIPINYIVSKRVYLKSGGFSFDIPIYEDWDLKIRIASICPFYYSGIIGTAYRKHGQGLSSANLLEHIKWLKIVFNKNRHLLKKEHMSVYQSFDIAIKKYEDALDSN